MEDVEYDNGDDYADPEYVHFDISLDVLASLELAAGETGRAELDSAWKWIIVGVHMAATSAAVGYLTDSAGFGALTDRDHALLAQWLDSSNHTDAPPDRIAEFPILIDRLQLGKSGVSGQAVIGTDDIAAGLKKLNTIRSRFNHFREEGWSIEKAYVLPLIRDGVTLVKRIREHGWAFRHASQKARERMDTCIAQLLNFSAA